MNKFETIDAAIYAEKKGEPTKPPVVQEVHDLQRQLDETETLLDKLGSRLHPVTRVTPEPEEIAEAEMTPEDKYILASPLLGDIQYASRQVRSLSRRIGEIINSVDL